MRECYRCNWIIILIVAIAIVPVNSVLATNTHIQTDNSLSGVIGLSVNATGSNHLYTLSEVNGQASGGNLFFSFSHFNIGNSDTAWFNLNTPNLENVISRVTGGSESVIDGQLKMTNIAGGNAPSFFFINPAGITFGASSSVDVPGSFYASTASNLNFSDGAQYPANIVHASTLSSANPESFGFLGHETGNLNLGSSETGQTTLAFKPGTDVAFVANHIHITNAAITNVDSTRAGLDMQLIATGKDTSNIKLIDLPNQAGAGELTVQNATLDASGSGSGRIAVRSGNFNAANSSITVNNTGNISMSANDGINVLVGSELFLDHASISSKTNSIGNAGSIDIHAGFLKLIVGGLIESSTTSQGNSGAITISANHMAVYHQYYSSNGLTGIMSQSKNSSGTVEKPGNAGDITIAIKEDLKLIKGGVILSNTASKGNAGNVMVNSGQLEISSGSGILSESIYIHENNEGELRSGGNAGKVIVMVADMLELVEFGLISADSFTNGKAGEITISAAQMEASKSSSISSASLNQTINDFSGGGSGNVTITVAGKLKVADETLISSSTASNGKAGEIIISAEQMELSGDSLISSTSIGLPGGMGDAGGVTVLVSGMLKLMDDGSISTSTFSNGSAGLVTVNAGQLEINHSEISSDAEVDSSGKIGGIDINIKDDIRLSNSARISIENAALPPESLIRTIINLTSNSLYLDNSSISTLSKGGDSGSITINGSSAVYLHNSPIITSVLGQSGDGGGINITSNALIMDTGFIQANTQAAKASGGKIIIAEPTMIIPSSNFLIIGGSQEDFTPFSGRNVIQAVAPNGQSVPPVVGAAQLNLSGALANLNTESFGASEMNQNMCAVDSNSSFLQSGKGGQRPRARDFLLSTMQ